MDPLAPPPDARHAFTADGEIFLWRPQERITVQRARGVLSLPLAGTLTEFYAPILEERTMLRIFVDFDELTHYTRDARELVTAFTREHIAVVESIHILLSSKLVALGVSAFKHDVGDERVAVYSDRASFVRSLEKATLEVRGRALVD